MFCTTGYCTQGANCTVLECFVGTEIVNSSPRTQDHGCQSCSTSNIVTSHSNMVQTIQEAKETSSWDLQLPHSRSDALDDHQEKVPDRDS